MELEPQLKEWLDSLPQAEVKRVQAHMELLESRGVLLGEPHTRQLEGKLRELRFHLGGRPVRVSYFVASGRRIILLTVFTKKRRVERREIHRARNAILKFIAEERQ